MTTIQVKLQQRVADLDARYLVPANASVNYLSYYLDYTIVRALTRGAAISLGTAMIKVFGEDDEPIQQRFPHVEASLTIFVAVTVVMVFYSWCCFAEVKVARFDPASQLAQERHHVLRLPRNYWQGNGRRQDLLAPDLHDAVDHESCHGTRDHHEAKHQRV